MASPGSQPSPSQPSGGGSGSIDPAVSEPGPISFTPKWTADEYIRAIAHHSQQTNENTLYPGDIYKPLAQDLKRGPVAPEAKNPVPDGFAWLVSPGHQAPPTADDQENQRQSEGFSDVESCIEALRNNIEASHPQVLFLRGCLPPGWVSSIGAFCDVDPELFRWFTRYAERAEDGCYFGSAPLAMSSIFCFTFFTIVNTHQRKPQLAADVHSAEAALESVQAELRTWGRGRTPGESIVRKFYELDELHWVMEQEMAISIFEIGKTWMAIACTDAGQDFTHGPPRHPLGATLVPIIQYRSKCALESGVIPKMGGNTQSLAAFPERYGRYLDWASATSDRFPALSEVFRLSAFSRKQLLNLLKRKIIAETDQLQDGFRNWRMKLLILIFRRRRLEKLTLANLLYYRDILQDQVTDLSQMLLLTNGENRIFHNSASRPPATAHNALDMDDVHSLLQDLHSQARSLAEKCSYGMTVISNNSMLEESQRAIQQAKQVTKLTLVAFVYLPFTFTAGFFGMNLRELEASKISLWVYFVISIPLTIISVVFFLWNPSSMDLIRYTLQKAKRGMGYYYGRLRDYLIPV
ncbi:hypothetical protein B0J18DRAFT_197543 [Chaetomium sp. MPI-SDFR-AT-0129]|nr:hypothetical protein B0J18DRAFT_197543 [Chaetomium sp. MPI-SDFR-AT-0129]